MELESWSGLDYIICVGLVVISCWRLVNLARHIFKMDTNWYWYSNNCALAFQ